MGVDTSLFGRDQADMADLIVSLCLKEGRAMFDNDVGSTRNPA